MSNDLTITESPAGPAEPRSSLVIRSGADLVHVVEDLHMRLFMLTLALLGLSSLWSICARLADATRGQLVLTLIFGASGLAAALLCMLVRRPAYLWLRYNRIHQFTPAVVAIAMLLADGPHSATWWMAFALIVMMALVSSTSLTVTAAVCAAAAYIGGTLLYHAPVIDQGDATNVFGAAQLIVYALIARAVFEAFGGFVLRLHRLELENLEVRQPARKVKNLASPTAHPPRPTARRRSPTPRALTAARSLLTTRQLEVALLLRDGLHQHEIAACLSISKRQVERLIEQARARARVATTSELVAKLVRGKLVPPPAGALQD